MEQLSPITYLLMFLSTLIVGGMMFKATGYSKITLMILFGWAAIVSALALNNFYRDETAMPPRLVFMVGPPLLLMLTLFFTHGGRRFIDKINIADLHLLHVARIPVEMMLHQLFVAALVPQIMTYEGWNFDIFSGVSSLVIYYFGFVKKSLPNNVMLLWNFLCLALLFIIVYVGILSAQTPFQKYAFDQPNTGVTFFPFVWLPAIVVPAVLFSHLVSIRQLLKK